MTTAFSTIPSSPACAGPWTCQKAPAHLGNINRCFSPTQAEVDHANEVLAALEEGKRQGRGAVALHGKMIDAPIAARAKRTLADAEQILKRGGTLA